MWRAGRPPRHPRGAGRQTKDETWIANHRRSIAVLWGIFMNQCRRWKPSEKRGSSPVVHDADAPPGIRPSDRFWTAPVLRRFRPTDETGLMSVVRRKRVGISWRLECKSDKRTFPARRSAALGVSSRISGKHRREPQETNLVAASRGSSRGDPGPRKIAP
jgi:hypothetical protein